MQGGTPGVVTGQRGQVPTRPGELLAAHTSPCRLAGMDRLHQPADIIAHVDAVLEQELGTFADELAGLSPVASELTDPIRSFCVGGKRIRALATWWGYQLAGGTHPGIAHVAASVELLHAAALIHDDIIDNSDTRRGNPSTHAFFSHMHSDEGFGGDARSFGINAAIIAGDVCLGLSEQLFTASGLEVADSHVRATHDAFRRDVMLGQYLDIRIQAAPVPDAQIVDRAMEVLTYKSAKYSVEQPFELGARLAGAKPEFVRALSTFTLPLGQAFQLRDDELGVFGDPQATGKPAGDDLVEGKKTVLVGLALARMNDDDAQWFRERLGTDSDTGRMIELLDQCGAKREHEDLIDSKLQDAFVALDALGEHGVSSNDLELLRAYANRLTRRDT